MATVKFGNAKIFKPTTLMKYLSFFVLMLLADTSLAQVNGDLTIPKNKTYVLDFNSSLLQFNAWSFGVSDYNYIFNGYFTNQGKGFVSRIETVPLNYRETLKGGFMSSINVSDDMFMFTKRKVTGLLPNTEYRATFQVQIATKAGRNCVGVGGAPGEDVTLKAGATGVEPLSVPVFSFGGGVYSIDYRMNIDKGDQRIGGKEMIVLGDIAGTSTNCIDNKRYELKELASTEAVSVKTNWLGEAWVIVGTDSGYEGETSLYITKVTADFKIPLYVLY